MSLPPLPTTTLAIIINRVQRMGQIPRHGEQVLQIVWWGGAKTGAGGEWSKKDARRAPGALTLPLSSQVWGLDEGGQEENDSCFGYIFGFPMKF